MVNGKTYEVYLFDYLGWKLKRKADLIFVDPPFGINFQGNLGTYNRTPDTMKYVEVPVINYPKFINGLVTWSYNNSSPTASMWILSGWNNLHIVLNEIEKVGWKQLNHCIWKYQFGVFTKKKFVTSHYHVLLLVKDKKNYTFNKPEHYPEDVWVINRPYHVGEETAGNELPDELVKKCILTSSNERDLIVDPCLGSGTTLKVCLETNRDCLGFEINPLLKKRIEQKINNPNIKYYTGKLINSPMLTK